MHRRTPWGAWLGIVVAACVAYLPAWHGALLWDDDAHVTRAALQSWEGLWRIWTEPGATQQYYPVLHSTFWLLHQLWGDATTGYHLLNIALHATSACLLTWLLMRLAVPGALFAGCLFALHPVQVESVAWISELKNTLSGVLYLAAALWYVRFDRTREGRAWWTALGLFVVALLTKSVTASLPAALLVAFWWERGALDRDRDVRPLVPFFGAGLLAGAVTIWMERTFIGAVGPAFDLTVVERVLVAGRALWFYAWTWVWPVNLSFVYPRWEVDQAIWWQYLFPVAAAAALWVCWRVRVTRRGPFAVALLMCVGLAPALGFVNVYPFIYSYVADHFFYLASMALAAGTASLVVPALQARVEPVAVTTVVCVVLGVLTWRQAGTYVDAETLYLATIERNPAAWMAHLNLGFVRLQRGQVDAAIRHSEEALRLEWNLPQAHNNLGAAFRAQGRLDAAERALQTSLTLAPGDERTRYNLGLVLIDQQRPAEALPHIDAYLAVVPDDGAAQAQRGDVLQSLERFTEAIDAYREAIRLEPGSAQARTNLGSALGRTGRHEDALAQFADALRIDAGYLPAARNRAFALLRLGRIDEGIAQLEDVLRRAPSEAARADLEYARSLK